MTRRTPPGPTVLATRRSVSRVLAFATALLGTIAPLSAQADRATHPDADSVPGAMAESLPPEYDPGADHHFLLPTGEIAPHMTGGGGVATAALPVGGLPFATASVLPRTSFRFSALLTFEGLDVPMAGFGSVTVQPIDHELVDVSVTALTNLNFEDADHFLGAFRVGLVSASFGDDRRRFTIAGGGISRGSGYGRPKRSGLLALGWDVELDSRDPRIVEVGGARRTVRRRIKTIGELWTPVGDGSAWVVGVAGLRYSSGRAYFDLVLPFALDGGTPAVAPVPLINLGFTV